MSIRIERVGTADSEMWNRCVERSSHTNLFHQYEALDLLARYSDSVVHPLIGYNGQTPIGLFPVFELKEGRLCAVRSPPPILESFYLGPAHLNIGKTSQRKTERYAQSFIDNCLEWISEEIDPELTHIRTDGRYSDIRPFIWRDSGYRASPYYTYIVDLTLGTDTLWNQFSSDVRSNVRDAEDTDHVIEEGDIEDIEFITEQVRRRLTEQDKESVLPPGFLPALYKQLPAEQVRPYICRIGDERVGGNVFLEYGDTVYAWQGAVKTDTNLAVTDLVHWQAMCDSVDRGIERYDLIGANIPRLCSYKAKFGPHPLVYFNIHQTRGLGTVRFATRRLLTNVGSSETYRRLREGLNRDEIQ